MSKRGRLEIVKDILRLIQENNNSIKVTPLLRKSNLSSQRFNEYLGELLKKGFVIELDNQKKGKYISLTDKGLRYIGRYEDILKFIEEFDL